MRTFLIFGGLLGAGLGGFVDGIVFHQILGWHHLVCLTEHCRASSVEHLQQQNRQDGFFHLATLVATMWGSYGVFRHAPERRPARLLFGAVLAGWGLFNFIEGVINHHVLGIHHVLPGSAYQFAADMGFLASGVLLFMLGYRLVAVAQRALHMQDDTRR